jgi:hypothetical protein
MPIQSPRFRRAIRAFGLARHELVEALSLEAPGRVVISGKHAFGVVHGAGGSPRLVAGRVIRLAKGRPSSPSSELSTDPGQ